MREIIDTEAPVGNHTLEVSCAKVEVADLFYRRTDLFDFEYVSVLGDTRAIVKDPIDTAEVIVEMLIGMGWRPTREVENDAPTDAEIEAAASAMFETRDDPYNDTEWGELTSADREWWECYASAALVAARKVSGR